ncbi:lysophospholipid acyltransferase family protein [Maribacter sp. PR1]|uniref:Lysophospholipid acyltransferase family protein n=1 Tax=Maribacter cobaltidurans TaxID=1178778 RepID=A0ABU7IZ83_9FLAO|nr:MULTISPECIES: lysophospholipid acyltransferase family protein [Maribacter]MDC6390902.1 lysophospholipid acyltransferase family protein [Maribacter sp. PR1]MEE1978294.1 lysophospholipid acyltransferase family protein [Maribacter cobaltidurans]
MQKMLSYIVTPFFFVAFGITLLVFHPILWLSLNLFGYPGIKRTVSLLNLSLMRSTNILGTTYKFSNPYNIPIDRPLIIVTNHQSMYDIPPIIWYMRKHHPKFVSKKELGKGIPSVSYNLRHGGSVLIDRKDAKGSIIEIGKLGAYIEKHNRTAVIFPEGTRSRDGHPKPFKPMGLKMLMKKAPSALIVPISINNSWKLVRFGKFPMGLGAKVSFDVHEPIENNGDLDELLAKTEAAVVSGINSFK